MEKLNDDARLSLRKTEAKHLNEGIKFYSMFIPWLLVVLFVVAWFAVTAYRQDAEIKKDEADLVKWQSGVCVGM